MGTANYVRYEKGFCHVYYDTFGTTCFTVSPPDSKGCWFPGFGYGMRLKRLRNAEVRKQDLLSQSSKGVFSFASMQLPASLERHKIETKGRRKRNGRQVHYFNDNSKHISPSTINGELLKLRTASRVRMLTECDGNLSCSSKWKE